MLLSTFSQSSANSQTTTTLSTGLTPDWKSQEKLCSQTELLSSQKVILRPAVSRAVCNGVRHPSGAYDQIHITVRQLRLCLCGEHSLTRRRVCSLQLPLVLASAVILRFESRRTHDHILMSHLRLSNLEGQFPIFISRRNSLARWYQALGWSPVKKSMSHYDRQSVGQSVLVSGAHLRPATNLTILPTYNFSARTSRKHRSSVLPLLQAWLLQILPSIGRCIQSYCRTTASRIVACSVVVA
jgi:hypothetical protein